MGNCSSCVSSHHLRAPSPLSLEAPELLPTEIVELRALINRLENKNPFHFLRGIQPLVNEYNTPENKDLLRNFTFSKVKEILESENVDASKKELVKSALYEIYKLSFLDDDRVKELSDFFKEFLTNLNDKHSNSSTNTSESQSLRKRFNDLQHVGVVERLGELQELSQNTAFERLTQFQDLADNVIKERTLDFLKAAPIPPTDSQIESIQSVIDNLLDLLGLWKQIGKATIQCSNEIASTQAANSLQSYIPATKKERLQNEIKTSYAPELYEATYQLMMQAVACSYATNDKLQRTMKEMGKGDSVRITNFLTKENLNTFLEKYFTNQFFHDIDNLVDFFLNRLNEKQLEKAIRDLSRVPHNEKALKAEILLPILKTSGLTLENLDEQ